MAKTQPTIEQKAATALAYWQAVLGLQPWTITVAIAYALSVPASEAEIGVNWETETASLSILHPDVYAAMGLYVEQDVERAIVHELLHVLWDPLEPADRDSLEWRTFEQVLDRMARALVAVRRAG